MNAASLAASAAGCAAPLDWRNPKYYTGDWGETDDLLLALLDDADDNGAISLEEREDLLDADIIAAGKDVTGNDAYAVIEIGVTVSSADVNRAAPPRPYFGDSCRRAMQRHRGGQRNTGHGTGAGDPYRSRHHIHNGTHGLIKLHNPTVG